MFANQCSAKIMRGHQGQKFNLAQKAEALSNERSRISFSRILGIHERKHRENDTA